MFLDFLWRGEVSFTPKYDGLEAVAAENAPLAVVDYRASEEFRNCQDRLVGEIYLSLLGLDPSTVLFFTALLEETPEWLTVPAHHGSPTRCALFFTSSLRYHIYVDHLLEGIPLQAVEMTAGSFTESLKAMSEGGLENFVVDRCPYCWDFEMHSTSSVSCEEDAMRLWCRARAEEIALSTFYLRRCMKLREEGRWAEGKQLTLYAIAHASADDPRLHQELKLFADHLGDVVLAERAAESIRHIKVGPGLESVLQKAGC